jgi:hypothetical protein
VNLLLVASTDAAVEHNGAEAVGNVSAGGARGLECVGVVFEVGGDHGLADSKEVRTETSNEPFDENLEDGCHDERVEQTNGGVVDIPERPDPDLADEEDGEGNEEGHERSRPDGDDLVAKRVRKLGIDDLSISEGDCIFVSGGVAQCSSCICLPGKLRLGAGSAK